MTTRTTTWLPSIAVGTLAAGLALRTFIAAGLSPVGEALAAGLLLLGGGLVLADRAAKWNLPAQPLTYAVPLFLAWRLSGASGDAWLRTADLLALVVSGIALRDLVVGSALAPLLRRGLVTAGFMFGVFAVAQALYLRPAMRAEFVGGTDPVLATDMGRAFLASWRATAVFTSANVFASSLLVTLLPCLFLAARARTRSLAAWVVGGLGLAAAAAAGSAGGTVAAAFGTACGLAATRTRPPGSTWARTALALVVVAAGVLFALAWIAPDAASKFRTLNERLGYWTTGLRALFPESGFDPSALLVGTGAASADARMTAATRAGVPFSRDPHQALLSFALEFGIPFAAFLAALAFARLRSAVAALRTLDGLGDVLVRDPSKAKVSSHAVAFAVGLAVGTWLSGLAQRLVTFFPPSAEAPAMVDAAVWTILGIIGWKLSAHVRVSDDLADLAWLCGTLALAAHAMIDIHARITPVWTLGLAAAATLPGSGPCPTTRRRAVGRLLALLLGAFAVLASLPIVLKAQSIVLR